MKHNDSAEHRIWQVVSQIPAGKVASYGQIAQLAGLPNGARQVGRVLGHLPEDTSLPWHRVVNSRGQISLPAGSQGFEEQRQRLLAESVLLTNNRVNWQLVRWLP